MTIELPDEQAAALAAKAAAEGLTLQDWLRKLADGRAPVPANRESRYSLSELMQQCDVDVPLSVEEREWLDAPAIGREAS